ncbi:MAG: hypothetical protein ACP5GL_07515 [Infirmifilum sp.]
MVSFREWRDSLASVLPPYTFVEGGVVIEDSRGQYLFPHTLMDFPKKKLKKLLYYMYQREVHNSKTKDPWGLFEEMVTERVIYLKVSGDKVRAVELSEALALLKSHPDPDLLKILVYVLYVGKTGKAGKVKEEVIA